MGKERKKYTLDFKRDAVRMMRNRGTRTVAEVADDLGVAGNQLHRKPSASSV
jgi:transposase-like protein